MEPGDPKVGPTPASSTSGSSSAGGPIYLPVPTRAAKPSSAASQAALNPLALLRSLRRRWALALSLGLLLAAVVGATVWFVVPPPKDSVRTLLQIQASQPRIFFPTSEMQADFDSYRRMQMVQLKSRFVLNAALHRPKVAELNVVSDQTDAVEWLEKTLQADFSVGPEFLRISLSGDRPDELAVLLTAVTDTYLDEIVNKEHNIRLARLTQLKDLSATYAESMKRSRQELYDKAKAVGTINNATLAVKHRFALELRANAQQELLRITSDMRRAEIEIKLGKNYEKSALDRKVPDKVVEDYIQADPGLQKQRQRKALLEDQIKQIEEHAVRGKEEPRVKQAQKDLQVVLAEMEARRVELRPLVISTLRTRLEGDLQLSAALNEEKIAKLKELEKLLIQEIEDRTKETKDLGENELAMTTHQDNIKHIERFADNVTQEIEALKIEINAPARVRKLEEAIITRANPQAQKMKMTGLAAAAGLGLGLFGISFWEYRRRRIDSVTEVVDGLGMELFGTVPGAARPRWHRKSATAASPDPAWQSLMQESVDSTRTLLLHTAQTQALRVVMVTSAVSGEGKTSLSCHLAASLARAGQRTLLLDWDLRNPSAHRLFDLPRAPGLCEVLRGEAELADVIQAAPVGEGLWLATAGRRDAVALRALARGGPKMILDRVRDQYDFVIVDSCPILPVADSLLVAQYVDGVIVSVLQDVSQMPHVQAACERLTALGIHILGAVVNGTTDQVYGNKYAYYHYAGEPDPAEVQS